MRPTIKINISRMLWSISFLTSLLVMPSSVVAFPYWCQDWEKERNEVSSVDIKDLLWDGETLSLRYWDDVNERGIFAMYYRSSSGEQRRYDGSGFDFGTGSTSKWKTFYGQFRQRPTQISVTRTALHCDKFREPTMWEKITD